MSTNTEYIKKRMTKAEIQAKIEQNNEVVWANIAKTEENFGIIGTALDAVKSANWLEKMFKNRKRIKLIREMLWENRCFQHSTTILQLENDILFLKLQPKSRVQK
jgi:hypothetical protein